MSLRNVLILLFVSLPFFAHPAKYERNLHYPLTNDPIDVVIVTHPKDKETLDYCIDGIRENCSQVRRVIVVSKEKLTENAEWFDERRYPFSFEDVYLAIGRGDKKTSEKFFHHHGRPAGWYLQQLLKLYAPFVIPGISSNVLVIDSDTVFMNPVEFLNGSCGGLFGISYDPPKERYLEHAARLLPGYHRIYPEFYSVCHHMLFQKPILKDLFKTVEAYHRTEFWVAFCSCVDLHNDKGACSEYEIYYNYALTQTSQVELRELKWINSGKLYKKDSYQKSGYHYVSFHSYWRDRENKSKSHKIFRH